MHKYRAELTKRAEADIENIINYLKYLSGDLTANKYYESFQEALRRLEKIGSGMVILEEIEYRGQSIRRIHVKKCMMFYTIDTDNKLIRVLRVYHGSSNWQDSSKWV